VVGYLQGMMSLFFICHVGKVCVSMSCVSFMQVGGERERGRIAGKRRFKKTASLFPAARPTEEE